MGFSELKSLVFWALFLLPLPNYLYSVVTIRVPLLVVVGEGGVFEDEQVV